MRRDHPREFVRQDARRASQWILVTMCRPIRFFYTCHDGLPKWRNATNVSSSTCELRPLTFMCLALRLRWRTLSCRCCQQRHADSLVDKVGGPSGLTRSSSVSKWRNDAFLHSVRCSPSLPRYMQVLLSTRSKALSDEKVKSSNGPIGWTTHPRCKRVTWTRQKGDDPKTDPMTKGADSDLPGWQPKEKAALTAKAGYDCFNNATFQLRPEAVRWGASVWQARWLPPFGDCGSVASCHRAMVD